jgi:hypothetical protein
MAWPAVKIKETSATPRVGKAIESPSKSIHFAMDKSDKFGAFHP